MLIDHSEQKSLFDLPRTFDKVPFAGETFDEAKDRKRLSGQMLAVYEAMRSGEWFTLRQLADIAGGSEAGVSARIRDLRKKEWGGYTVERERLEGGLWRYRMAL